MNCPSCKTGNAEHAQHCVRCGTALGGGEPADTFMGGGPASAETSAAGHGVHTSAGVLSPVPTPASRSKSSRGSQADQTLVGTDFSSQSDVRTLENPLFAKLVECGNAATGRRGEEILTFMMLDEWRRMPHRLPRDLCRKEY